MSVHTLSLSFIPFECRRLLLSKSVTLGPDLSWRVEGWAHFSGCQALSPLMNPLARGLGRLAHALATGRWLMTGGEVFGFALISPDQCIWQHQSPGGHWNWALRHPVPNPWQSSLLKLPVSLYDLKTAEYLRLKCPCCKNQSCFWKAVVYYTHADMKYH